MLLFFERDQELALNIKTWFFFVFIRKVPLHIRFSGPARMETVLSFFCQQKKNYVFYCSLYVINISSSSSSSLVNGLKVWDVICRIC